MKIEIHRPELVALITERMKAGGFRSVEDVLMHAFANSPLPAAHPADAAKDLTGADLIAAMQSSPFRKLEIEPVRFGPPERDPKA